MSEQRPYVMVRLPRDLADRIEGNREAFVRGAVEHVLAIGRMRPDPEVVAETARKAKRRAHTVRPDSQAAARARERQARLNAAKAKPKGGKR